MAELRETIERSPAEVVAVGTPIDLGSLLHLNKPYVRVEYELKEVTQPDLASCLKARR